MDNSLYQENSSVKKEQTKNRVIICIIIGIIILGIIIVGITAGKSSVSSTYDKAVGLVEHGSYDEAKELFDKIEDKNYQDTSAYIALCEAHIDYDNDDILGAHDYIDDLNFDYLTSEQSEEIDNFIETIKSEFSASYTIELVPIEDYSDYIDDTTYDIPEVGMPESKISETSLGEAIRYGGNSETINGEIHDANLYRFIKDDSIIFSARCIDGKVYQVWDYRDDPIPITKSKTKTDKDYDPYDVNDYDDAEEFYEDNYDDFSDYEDAELYFDEHHK